MIYIRKGYIYTIFIGAINIIYEALYLVPENIALYKPATQLGTYRDNVAGRAVDGDTRQYLIDGSCAHPHSLDVTLPADVRGSRAWWSVDLSAGNPSQTYIIRNVTIYFRRLHQGKIVCM